MRHLILVFFCLISIQVMAQYSTRKKSAIAYYEEGLRSYRMMDFKAAEVSLNLAIEKDENFYEPHLLLGEISLETKQYEKGLFHFKQVEVINPNVKPLLYLNLAEIELLLAQYDSAKMHLVKFTEKYNGVPDPLREKWSRLNSTAEFGRVAIQNPVPFDPINLGTNINTQFDEYHPSITVDGAMLVFTGKDVIGKSQSGRPVFKEDLYYANSTDQTNWQRAVNFGAPINTKMNNEGSSSISHDGRYLFYTGCNLKTGYGSCDIYMSKREGGKWSEPVNIGNKVNTSAWESHPSLSPDGQWLYFTSNRKGGVGGADLWRSRKDSAGNWQDPENLEINTKFSDMTPYIHADGKTFYFSSDGRPGMGGHDIFISRLNEKGRFERVVNLGYPINSELEEYGMIADPQGRMAYYASEMKGGSGGLDLYQFVLPENARPVVTQSISGVVYDKETGKKLDANIELIDLETGRLISSTASDKISGKFLVALASERDYALNVSRSGYLFYSDNFSLKGKAAEKTTLEVPLSPIKSGEKVVLKNVFFETSSYDLKPESKVELSKLVQMLQSNPSLRVEIGGHTDNVGNEENNQLLSTNRANAVRDYLMAAGISSSRLVAKGYGSSQPIADNNTAEGRAKNRRTEFTVLD